MMRTGSGPHAFALFVVLAFAAVPCTAKTPAQDERGPSTPEERAKVVRLTRQLEREPLGKDAKDVRQSLTVWLIHVPDIVVQPCGSLLGPVVNTTKDDYSAELNAQMNFSQAAYIIENPSKARDIHALLTASLEGALKAYEAILKKRPAARRPYLDDLLTRRDQGEIGAYVRQAMAGCR
jgi:carboxypeptidase Q